MHRFFAGFNMFGAGFTLCGALNAFVRHQGIGYLLLALGLISLLGGIMSLGKLNDRKLNEPHKKQI